MSNQSLLRITRELNNVQKNTDLSIAVASQETNLHHVKALIVGPSDTPYEFGFFEFAVKFPTDYPDNPPSIVATTTNGGRCRFNPNIYSQGKVCLSILGTWRGERGELWSSAQGLESILISIQSLMSANPYENEPGYEHANTPSDKKQQAAYIAKIRHETLRISIIQRMESYLGIFLDGTILKQEAPDAAVSTLDEPDEDLEEIAATFEPFKDLCKRRFLWYYESYQAAIEAGSKQHKPGEQFKQMAFEGGGNSMQGQFDYPELGRRLTTIKQVLVAETTRWGEEGAVLFKRENVAAAFMQRQYQQVVEAYKKNDTVTLDIEMKPNNPFVWLITYFGRPMTQLDGGMFRVRMSISPRFPDELPRVTFETPMFHHRIAKDGTVCYLPTRQGELQSHIKALIEAIEEEHPPYDPRTLVNVEAAKLFWGSPDEKKQYNRQLRRAVQRSVDG